MEETVAVFLMPMYLPDDRNASMREIIDAGRFESSNTMRSNSDTFMSVKPINGLEIEEGQELPEHVKERFKDKSFYNSKPVADL